MQFEIINKTTRSVRLTHVLLLRYKDEQHLSHVRGYTSISRSARFVPRSRKGNLDAVTIGPGRSWQGSVTGADDVSPSPFLRLVAVISYKNGAGQMTGIAEPSGVYEAPNAA